MIEGEGKHPMASEMSIPDISMTAEIIHLN